MVQKCIALSFVLLHQVDEAWMLIHSQSPDTQKTTQFLDYMVTTWIESTARFQKSSWNHSEDMCEQSNRTNNALEAWHGRLRKKAGKAHPNLFEFVVFLKEEQKNTECDITQLQ